jgi:hypothetical protein
MDIENLKLSDLLKLINLLNVNNTQSDHPMLNKHCIIRTYSAGVHIGTPIYVSGTETLLKNSRRLWKWDGAFTLSEVAIEGVNISGSRISMEVPEIFLTEAIEFIPTTEKSRKSFEACHE